MLALLSTHTDSITTKGPLNPTNNWGAHLPVCSCACRGATWMLASCSRGLWCLPSFLLNVYLGTVHLFDIVACFHLYGLAKIPVCYSKTKLQRYNKDLQRTNQIESSRLKIIFKAKHNPVSGLDLVSINQWKWTLFLPHSSIIPSLSPPHPFCTLKVFSVI